MALPLRSSLPTLDSPQATGRGRYAVLESLGSGAMGTVYRGYDRVLSHPVAIKHIHPHLASARGMLDALQREARAGARIDHPNVARTLDFERNAAGSFIVMELLQGLSLADVLNETARPPLQWTLSIIAQVLAGLAAAHDRGVIHRDIKPENVMLERVTNDDGCAVDQVKLCDFGIASVADMHLVDEDGRPLTFRGARCGTPGYMAPEQLASMHIDHRADLFATGVMLHEMVTGQPPADDRATGGTPGQPPLPPPPSALGIAIDPALERVIMHALEPDPGRRYDSARAMRAELRECMAAPARAGATPALEELLQAAIETGDAAREASDSGVRPRVTTTDFTPDEVEAFEHRLRRGRAWPLAAAAALTVGVGLFLHPPPPELIETVVDSVAALRWTLSR